MKKILLFAVLLPNLIAAQYTTGLQNFTATSSAKLDISASLATLTITGPADRWFGFSFAGSSISNMAASLGIADLVAYDGTNLTDRSLGGIGAYDLDTTSQDWTITSNTATVTTRTIIATRALNTGDADDIVFTNAPGNIYIAWVRSGSAGYTFGPHNGLTNAGRASQPIGLTLGVEDFTLNATKFYPNPSKNNLTIETKTTLNQIDIYSQNGQFLKTISVNNLLNTTIDTSFLSTGIYLIELKNETESAWKKLIIE